MFADDPVGIMCGQCRAAVRVSTVGRDTIVVCSICGESDTLEAARREAGRHTAHLVLSRLLRSEADGRPALRFRFIEAETGDAALRVFPRGR